MLKKKFRGSTTVEAAFILPILIFCIFALLYLGFDLHDRVCLQSILDQMGREAVQEALVASGTSEVSEVSEASKASEASEASETSETSEISMEEIGKRIENKVNKKLCISSISNVSVKEELLTLKIRYTVTKKVSFTSVSALFKDKALKKKEQVKKYNPMKAVRSLGGIVANESGI